MIQSPPRTTRVTPGGSQRRAVGWAIGFYAYSLGAVIHILLVIAIVAVLLQVIRGKRI